MEQGVRPGATAPPRRQDEARVRLRLAGGRSPAALTNHNLLRTGAKQAHSGSYFEFS
jgi:hypothetical protein